MKSYLVLKNLETTIMEVIIAKMRALKISFAEKFCGTFDLTWWKFSPVVTSTPIKRNLWSSVNSIEMDFECDTSMIDAGEPMSVDLIQSN